MFIIQQTVNRCCMFFVLICTTAETFYRFHGLLVVVVNLTDLSGTGRRAAPQRCVSGGREERAWRFSAGHPEHGLHHRVPEEPLHGRQALLRGHGIPPAPPALRLPQGVPGSVQCLFVVFCTEWVSVLHALYGIAECSACPARYC